jgi:hypothetical protein
MATDKPDQPRFRPGDWVLIDFAAPRRDEFAPNAFGRVVAKIPVKKPWYSVEFVYLADGEFAEGQAPASALRHHAPTKEEIALWETSRSTAPIPA